MLRGDPNRVTVCQGECVCHSIQNLHVFHRDFPEIWSEGNTPAEAAEHLAHQLWLAAEAARSQWQRDAVEQAIADVAAFREGLPAAAGGEKRRRRRPEKRRIVS